MAAARDNSDWDVWVSKVDLRLQCGMPSSKLEVSTVQHGTLSGAGYLHQSREWRFGSTNGWLSPTFAGAPLLSEESSIFRTPLLLSEECRILRTWQTPVPPPISAAKSSAAPPKIRLQFGLRGISPISPAA